jgi:hypothetical protein
MNAENMDGLVFSNPNLGTFIYKRAMITLPELGIFQREHPPQSSDYVE